MTTQALLELFIVGAALLLRVAAVDYVAFAYLLLALYALLGRSQALQALALCWLFNLLNPELTGGEAPFWSRHVVLVTATVSVLVRSLLILRAVQCVHPIVLATLALGAFLVFHAAAFSRAADISLLKAILWSATMGAVVSAWANLTPDAREAVGRRLWWGLTATLCASAPLLPSEVGYQMNGVGFQGVFSHPQNFGVTAALLGAWSWCRFLTGRHVLASAAVAAGCVGFVFLSGARTGGLALALGSITAMALMPALVPGGLRAAASTILRWRVVAVVMVLLAAAYFQIGAIGDFLTKQRGGPLDVLGRFYDARGEFLLMMWDNIQQDPWRGIGFGVASLPELVVVERTAAGLPVSAYIEKGIMPVAFLEETGLFGLLGLVLWCWLVLRRGARAGLTQLTVGLTILFINIGESMLFSPGGVGLLFMILFGWVAAGGRPAARPSAPAGA